MPLRLAAFAMGTRFELVLADEQTPSLRAAGEAALEEITLWHDRLSLFERDSLVSHINRTAAHRAVRIDPPTFDLLAQCADISRDSLGAFDPTIAPLMRSLGFHDDGSGSGDPAAVGFNGIQLDRERSTIRFTRPGMAIDLGAVAKGHALDQAHAVLREAGVRNALIHGGTSTVIALGSPPGEQGWRIRVANTTGNAEVTLRDAAMSVSSPAGRTLEADGNRIGHVLDPRTGEPAAKCRLAVTIGQDATRTDAWSTALLVLDEIPPAFPQALTGFREGDRGVDGRGPLADHLMRQSRRQHTQCSKSTDARS